MKNMAFLLSLILSFSSLMAGKDDLPYAYTPLRKTVSLDGELYGIENKEGFAAFRWKDENPNFPLLLGPYNDSYNLRVLKQGETLTIAYGPQVYGLNGKKFAPLFLKKNTGHVDAFHWMGFMNHKPHVLKKINRGEFVLYDLTQSPLAIKLRRPANGPALGKDIFHMEENHILQGGTKSTTLIQMDLNAEKPLLESISLPSPYNLEEVLGTFTTQPLRWYGATTGKNPHFYVFDLEGGTTLWGFKLASALACPPLIAEDRLFLVIHKDYKETFSLTSLGLNASSPQQIKGNLPSPHIRSLHLDQVVPMGPEKTHFFLMWHYTETNLETQMDEERHVYSILDTHLHTLSPLKDLPHPRSRYVMTQEDGTILLTH